MQLQLIEPVESQKDSWGWVLYRLLKTQLSRKGEEAQGMKAHVLGHDSLHAGSTGGVLGQVASHH